MADLEADRTPYTVRGMARLARETVLKSARQAGETQAEWLARAIANEADRQAGATVIPPSQTWAAPPADQTPTLPVEAHDLAALLQGCAAVLSAPGATKGLTRAVSAAARHWLRQARGLPPLPPRLPGGLPPRQIGLTVREAG